MTRVRTNLRQPGSEPWAPPVLWYARAVAVMKQRAVTDKTSWRYFAAIHGFDQGLWERWNYLSPGDALPPQAERDDYWDQCQHQSWYFLPWHRGYIKAIEDVLRAIIADELEGPDDWALPYWNYFQPGQAELPIEFASVEWPDRVTSDPATNNPLFVAARFGRPGIGLSVDIERMNLRALDVDVFTDFNRAGGGFGGPSTGFHHGGGAFGRLEAEPHGRVHVDIGGQSPNAQSILDIGLMAAPESAGLDPIFWMHHVNIDRLWEVWRTESPASHLDPTDDRWLNGPTPEKFRMPRVGDTSPEFTPAQVLNLADYDVAYDDLTRGAPTLEDAPEVTAMLAVAQPRLRSILPMDRIPTEPELIGSNDEPVNVVGEASSNVLLADEAWTEPADPGLTSKRFELTSGPQIRVFLNLEGVRGLVDTSVCDVYIGVPDGEDPAAHPELRAGTIAPFGIRRASELDSPGGAEGLTFVFDITSQAAALLAENPRAALPVRVVPVSRLQERSALSIERIGIYRQVT